MAQIVGAYVFPHGAITLDPETRDFTNIPAVKPTSKAECIKLHNAMRFNAANLVDTRPDLIILSTPHGLRLEKSFLFLANKKAQGSAQWDGDWVDYTAEFDIESDISTSLVKHLSEQKNAVEILRVGAAEDPLPLRWGEAVPWWFINQAAENVGYKLPPVVFIGHPSRRADGTQIMIPEILKLGGDVFNFLQNDSSVTGKKVALVISSDLSHYHSSDPTSPYPYSEFAVVFDAFVEQWAKIDQVAEEQQASYDKLVSKAGGVVDEIGTCGYTGLVFLQGILSQAVNSGLRFEKRMLYYSAPTYYGMMVNSWVLPWGPKKETCPKEEAEPVICNLNRVK